MTAHIPDALAAALREWFDDHGWLYDQEQGQDHAREILAHLSANHAETLREWLFPDGLPNEDWLIPHDVLALAFEHRGRFGQCFESESMEHAAPHEVWNVCRKAITQPARFGVGPVEVTNAMVERALDAWEHWYFHKPVPTRTDRMRVALVSALKLAPPAAQVVQQQRRGEET